jgi:pyrroloquinoline quinone (PQQ) biosynthesis protein C
MITVIKDTTTQAKIQAKIQAKMDNLWSQLQNLIKPKRR